jgi:hypothetical protein
MSLLQSGNNNAANLPKLLGKRVTTPDKLNGKENGIKHLQFQGESGAFKESNLLQKLANEYTTEKAIESIDAGDYKAIYCTNAVNLEYTKQ